MIKTKTWILILSVIFVVCVALSCLIFLKPAKGKIANIYLDGKCIRSVDLSKKMSDTFVIECENGSNTIKVENGKICVCSADCPDKTCVKSGWISKTAAPIVCLPHRLVIRIEENEASKDKDLIDSVSK